MARERDYGYEALAESTNTDMDAGRGELNAALASIREQVGLPLGDPADSYLLGDEIHRRARQYRHVMGAEVILTPTALAKHWKRVEGETRQRQQPVAQGTNRSVVNSDDCATCDGDRFVVMQTRPAGDGEADEMAPCPDCNGQVVSWRRADGQRMTTPDPDRVRERLAR